MQNMQRSISQVHNSPFDVFFPLLVKKEENFPRPPKKVLLRHLSRESAAPCEPKMLSCAAADATTCLAQTTNWISFGERNP